MGPAIERSAMSSCCYGINNNQKVLEAIDHGSTKAVNDALSAGPVPLAFRQLRDLIREVPIDPRFIYGDVARGVMRLALQRQPGDRARASNISAAVEQITARWGFFIRHRANLCPTCETHLLDVVHTERHSLTYGCNCFLGVYV